MKQPESRFRERLQAGPKGSSVRAGVLTRHSMPTGQVISTQVYDISGASSPRKIERTRDQVNPGPPYQSGGTFLGIKCELPHLDVKGQGTRKSRLQPNPGTHYKYVGGFTNPDFAADGLPLSKYMGIGLDVPPSTVLIPLASSRCSEVWVRLRPQLEKAGLGVALSEARDVPRMLQTTSSAFHDIWSAMGGSKTSQMMSPKGVSDNFLNHQFGWVPFVNDLQRFNDAVINSSRYMDNIRRHNNTWTNRMRVIDHDETEQLLTKIYHPGIEPWGINFQNMCTPQVINGVNIYGTYELRESIMDHVWAQGSFKYYRPEFDDTLRDYNSQWNELQRMLTIVGARVNPSVVYKATPWTWLIDWFSNVGNTIERANAWAFDSMVSRYIYLMHHRIRKVTFKNFIYFTDGPVSLEWVRYSDVKQRLKADNPYDFCLSWSNLTARQLAILGALGISRGGLGVSVQ